MQVTQILPNSYLIENFLYNDITPYFEHSLTWEKLYVNGRAQQREGVFMGDRTDNAEIWLRCPSIEGQTIKNISNPIKTMIESIRKSVTKEAGIDLNYDFNIVKIQKYNNTQIGMKRHSDKILDLEEGAPILITRFGGTRTAVLSNKKTGENFEVEMPSNSLLVLGYRDNLTHTHGVKQAENYLEERSYSVVIRKSVTWKHLTGLVFGPRTPFKTLPELIKFLKEDAKISLKKHFYTQEKQRIAMVRAFVEENNSADASLKIYDTIMENCIYQ
jgi:hypothetical protein